MDVPSDPVPGALEEARGITLPTYHNPERPYYPKPPAARREAQDWACLEVAVLGCPGPSNRVGRLLQGCGS